MIPKFSDYWTKNFCQTCRNCLLFVQRTVFWWNFLCGEKYMVFWLFQILTKNFSDFNNSSIRSQKIPKIKLETVLSSFFRRIIEKRTIWKEHDKEKRVQNKNVFPETFLNWWWNIKLFSTYETKTVECFRNRFQLVQLTILRKLLGKKLQNSIFLIFEGKNHYIGWKYKDLEQNFLQDDQGCSLISSGTRWLKSKKFFWKSRNKSQHCQQKFIHRLRRNTFEVFFQKYLYSWSFSEDEPDFLKTLEKKLWKFVETALYALRRKNSSKYFFWKNWTLYYSFRFREKKFTIGLCEFHSTCTEEQFGVKITLWKNS